MPEGLVVRRKPFTVPFGLGLLAGLAFGFAAGLIYLSIHRSVAAGALEDWMYPGCSFTGTSGAGTGTPFGPPLMTRQAMQATSDPFDQVANHYARKFGVNLPTAGGSGSRSSGSESLVYQSHNNGPGDARPLKTQTFCRRAAGGSIVVFITRADADEQTRIMLYWLPRQ